MNRAEFITYLRENHNMLRREAEEAVEAVVESIKDLVCAGETVHIAGFGQFMQVKKNERQGRDMNNGYKTVIIPAHMEPMFKPEKRFKDAVLENERTRSAIPLL